MEPDETVMERSRSVEDLHGLRLMALLHDLVRGNGQRGAGRVLGIDHRTVAACMESGELTWRMREALEQGLQSGIGPAAARQRDRLDALERHVGELTEEMRDGFNEMRAAVDAGLKALREEQAVTARVLGRRLDGLEARMKDGAMGSSAPAAEEPERPRYVPPRMFPQLVTREAEEGEEHVYGEATPLIVEWREAMKALLRADRTGPDLRRLAARERLWELEIALIGEHGLTLPPMTYPWTDRQREVRVWELREDLRNLHQKRRRWLRRRWLRRVLTLGFSWE